MERSYDVLVLGGGLVGLATARELAARQARVALLERRELGYAASSAGAGMLAPLSQGSEPPRLLALLRAARQLWRPWLAEITAEGGTTVEYDASGTLVAALDEAESDKLEAVAAGCRAAAEPVEEVELRQARVWVPDLAPEARRVLLMPDTHRVDNVQATQALARAAAARGVALYPHHEAIAFSTAPTGVSVETRHGVFRAATLVLAAGAWSGRIAGLPELPVHPVRGQMVRLEGVAWPWSGSVWGIERYAVRRGATGLLVGTTVEEAGFAEHPTAEGISDILAFARRLFPTLAAARLTATWAGLRPGSPDGRPLLGRLGDLPVVAACGHHRDGILLAPWTGRHLARHLLDGTPIPEGDLFAPDRFARADG